MADSYRVTDGTVLRETEQAGHRLHLDLSGQILSLDIANGLHSWQSHSHGSARDYRDPSVIELPLIPTLSDLRPSGFASASILGFKAKQFDDGLFAAVELAAQKGAGHFRGKAALLRDAANRLAAGPATQPAILTIGACRLAGITIEPESGLNTAAMTYVDGYLSNPRQSKPLGFYTWSRELEAIFRQDRLLQTELESPDAARIAADAFCGDDSDRETYSRYVNFIASMTNELVGDDLRRYAESASNTQSRLPVRIFPSSRSHEAGLVMKLHGITPIPDDFSLADTLIDAVVRGAVDLTPTATSGWYDHQTWALEPLIAPERMPERTRLELSEPYRRQLREVFKGLLAMTRETHVKQLMAPEAGAAPPGERIEFIVPPAISVEPLPEHYRRRAFAYRFVRNVLESMFGVDALESIHRMTMNGPTDTPLLKELRQIEDLFAGACMVAQEELGIVDAQRTPAPPPGTISNSSQFRDWLRISTEDTDLARDGRMMVPIFFDVQRQLTKVWAFLGWTTETLVVGFRHPPKAKALTTSGDHLAPEEYTVDFGAKALYPLAYPVTAELYVKDVLDRSEMAAVCDRFGTRSAILRKLSAED